MKAYFSFDSWIKVAIVLMGLSGLVGCASKPQSIVAQAALVSHPLATRTAVPSPTPIPATATPVSLANPSSTLLPPVSSAAAVPVEPDPTPALTLGQFPYSTSLQVVDESGVTRTVDVNFLLYLPGDYGRDPQRRWPLILFLHGAGERGYNPLDITRYSIPAFLTTRSDFPFIVLSPQSLPDDWWSNQVDMLDALLDQIQTEYAVDAQRIYLTGQSMGGYGTWALALKYPARFAALVPVASGYDLTADLVPPNICDLKSVPIWVFHGALDQSVPLDQVTAMVQALQNCAGNVRFTLYPDADHLESSNRAYADPALYDWLLRQSLK